MRQATLDRYVLTSQLRYPSPCLFLALPRVVRERIYALANLSPNRFIDLNCWTQHRCSSINSLVEEPNPHIDMQLYIERQYEEEHPPHPLPISLLFVCKVVSQEAQEILYRTNCFAISQRKPGGLRGLERLSALAIQNVHTLFIHLTPCTCLAPHCIKTPRQSPHVATSFSTLAFASCFASPRKQSHHRKLSTKSRSDRLRLAQWERVCHRLAEHIVPGQLSLYLISHVEGMPAAKRILQPLLQLPTLRNCGICFGVPSHTYYEELRGLAAAVVPRLTAAVALAPQKSFPFHRLPRELQLQILADSSLVQEASVRIVNGKLSRYCLMHSCDRARLTLDDSQVGLTLASFCTKRCAAFRTGCSNASWATYFTQVSLLNKSLADLATDVFFSYNAFSIHTWNANFVSQDNINLAGIHTFLERLSSHALGRMRRLTLLLPPISDLSLVDGLLNWRLWQASIQVLASKATLPILSLTVEIGSYWGENEGFDTRAHSTLRILQAYEKEVVRPLLQLRGLKRLFLYVPCPFGRDNEEARLQVERRLEQMVMGVDYDAYRVRKPYPDGYTRLFLRDEDE
jgi:hypothetical protein